jgi:hypothetical protein
MPAVVSTRRLGWLLAALWSSALALGLLLAAIPVVAPDRPRLLLPVLLFAATLPYGLLRLTVPGLWALGIGLPSALVGLARGDGWEAALLLAFALAGVYAGDLVARRAARPTARGGR